jgi:phosphoribosyl 1,2-cyclic phosphodiesterase
MDETLTFLGAAGARIMVANQILPSGGLWLNLNGTQILLDPGPGTIVQSTKRKLRGEKLSAIILSHRHLDHSGDTNIMVEAMTQGGFKKHGWFFAPSDALGEEPVLFSYLRAFLDGVTILEEGGSYSIGGVEFTTPVRHIHPVETYGLRFNTGAHTFSYIADTLYFDGIIQHYKADLLIINVLFVEPIPTVQHLILADAERIINGIKPKAAILNHFGMSMWRAHPWEIAERLTQQTGIRTIAARAGLTFDLAELDKI